MGLFFSACGALCGVASAESHRLPLSTSRLHSLHTREEIGEVEDVREKTATDLSVWTLVSLVRARAVLCVRETCRVQTCGRVSERVRVCTGCGAVSHAAVSCHVSVLFSVRGAVWRRGLRGKSPPPCPKGATTTSALTARFAHLPVCTCRGGPVRIGTILLPFREFASAECVSLSSRVTRGESSIRLTPV